MSDYIKNCSGAIWADSKGQRDEVLVVKGGMAGIKPGGQSLSTAIALHLICGSSSATLSRPVCNLIAPTSWLGG